MKVLLNNAALLLVVLIFALVVFGGGYIRTTSFKLEVGSVDPWALLSILISYIFFKVYKEEPKTLKFMKDLRDKLISLKSYYIILFLFFLVFLAHILKHLNFQTNMYDMAYVNQALFYPFEEKLLSCDVCKFGTYLGEHISYTMLIFTPLTMIFKSNILVFLIEKTLVFGSIFFLLKNILKKENRNLIGIFFLIILCHRSLRNSLFWDFREDHIGFFFVLLSLTFLYKKSITGYFVGLILALFSKEHVGIITAFLSLPIFFDENLIERKTMRKIVAASTFLLSISVVIVDFKFLFPLYTVADQSKNNIVLRFGEFGSTPREIIWNVLITPAYWFKLVSKIITKGAIKYTVIMFLPFTPLLKKIKWWFVPVAAGMGLNILSPLSNERMMIFHYDLILLSILVFAVVYKNREINEKMILISLIFALSFSGRWPLYYIKNFSATNVVDVSFINSIDKELTVAARMNHLAHLTTNKGIRFIDHLEKNHAAWETCDHKSRCFKEADVLVIKKDDNLLERFKSLGWSEIKKSEGNLLLLKNAQVP